METIATYSNPETGLEATVYRIRDGFRMRLRDLDTGDGENIVGFKDFRDVEEAKAYAEKCVA